MPHISKNKLSKKVTTQLFSELVSVLSPKQQAETKSILANLLSETEQVMFGKRLAAIFMISENVSIYKIAQYLHLSTSTVQRLQLNKDIGEYDELLTVIKERKFKKEQLWDFIDTVARLGMPSMGKDRWKSLR